MDCKGNVAYATSTGGIVNKMVGRVGDTPCVGRLPGWLLPRPFCFCPLVSLSSLPASSSRSGISGSAGVEGAPVSSRGGLL